MHLYLAGNYANLVYPEKAEKPFKKYLLKRGYEYKRLVSFWFYHNPYIKELLKREDPMSCINLADDDAMIMLDSGAHSFYEQFLRTKSGYHVESTDYAEAESDRLWEYVDRYAEFVKEHQDKLNVYVNMDIIFNPELSYKVYRYLRDEHDLNPLPVFHYTENVDDFRWLKKYMDETDYIGIGGLGQGISVAKYFKFGDRVFEMICQGKKGRPKWKTHGFALTSPLLMKRWPLYSVDSTSWVMYGLYGMILLPHTNKRGMFNVFVTERSKSTAKIDGRHFKEFGPTYQKYFLEQIESKGFTLGKTELKEVPVDYKKKKNERWVTQDDSGKRFVEVTVEPGLSNDHYQRDAFNAMFFMDMERQQEPWPWVWQKDEPLTLM